MEINFLDDHTDEAANYKLDTLLQLFPQGDFKYLRNKCIELAADDSAFEAFVNDALTTSVVPVNKQEENVLDPQEYGSLDVFAVSEFDVETFLEKFPDPFVYFATLESERTDNHKTQMFEFLKDRFRDVKSSFIEHVVIEQKYNLLRSAESLADVPLHAIRMDSRQDMDINLRLPWDPTLKQEVLLFDHQEEIRNYLKLQEEIKKTAIEEGQVFECECCYFDDVLPSDVIMCTEAHIFCKHCIKKSTEMRIGYGLLTFPCIHPNCAPGGVIPLDSIKTVLDNKTYQKVVARIQEEEVKKADIVGIEYCQRCEYAAVPDENIIIFKCEKCNFELCRYSNSNSKPRKYRYSVFEVRWGQRELCCSSVSCVCYRLCQKESHVPLKCGETVQDDIQKQERKKNEEFQTTKVLRRCGGCNKPYVKISGCHKVTCSCGTSNCYKCGASGIDYPHLDVLCEKESHVPLKCGETVQDDMQKQERKKSEELRTTKVLRRCGGCKKPYVKISGCDQVTCSCGTSNCYRCGAKSHSSVCTALDPVQ